MTTVTCSAIRCVGWLCRAVLIALLAAGCDPRATPTAPVLRSPTEAPTLSLAPQTPTVPTTACYTASTQDTACLLVPVVRYGPDPKSLTQLSAGRQVAIQPVTYVHATAAGGLVVLLDGSAICTAGSSFSDTAAWTRSPEGALLSLLRGLAQCSLFTDEPVDLGGGDVLESDGSVTATRKEAEIAASNAEPASIHVEYEPGRNIVIRVASGKVTLRLVDSGREFTLVRDDRLDVVLVLGEESWEGHPEPFEPAETNLFRLQEQLLSAP